MRFSSNDRAKVLIEALPFIKRYSGKTVVIKYGGNAMISDELKDAVMGDIVLLTLIGIRVVLVHGGGPDISNTIKTMGKETKFINGLRVTDAETAEIVEMVLCGKVNKGLVNIIGNKGGKAVGISGVDGQMLKATFIDKDLGFVGEVSEVNTELVENILDSGYIPVVSTIACDDDGNIFNINADTAAAKIAVALQAEALISMTDIVGLLRDRYDTDSLIKVVEASEVQSLIDDEIVTGGMIPKVGCCVDAVNNGVKKVFIIDGRMPHSILVELLTDEGIGTMFVKELDK